MNIKATELQPGDSIKIYQKGRAAFEGIVIKRRGGSGPSASFSVWAVLGGVGVEKIYPLHSPLIEKIELKKRAKVRQAKLYYLKDAKKAKKLKLRPLESKKELPKKSDKKDKKKTVKKTKSSKKKSRTKSKK